MIRTFLIVSSSGLVLYNKALLRSVEQPRLVGSLITALQEFALRQTNRLVSHIEMSELLVTMVPSRRAKITAVLFQDASDSAALGQLVATELLESFTDMFADTLVGSHGDKGVRWSRGHSPRLVASSTQVDDGGSDITVREHPRRLHRPTASIPSVSPLPPYASSLPSGTPGAAAVPSPSPRRSYHAGRAPGSSGSANQSMTLLDQFHDFDTAFADTIRNSVRSVVRDLRRVRGVRQAILLRGNTVISACSNVDQVALVANVQYVLEDIERLFSLLGDETRDLSIENELGMVTIRRLCLQDVEDDETTDTSSIGGLYSVSSIEASLQNSATVLVLVTRCDVQSEDWRRIEQRSRLIEDAITLHANLRLAI
ncbi:hypothetical protein CDCA_CDCA03G0819 [Cyanidium caldarium]|uniref:Uncharacterized protein n=1 Tax=Cyanidium caldarium TaxID=2771 RepID=A0AAV9IR48_CYACA|nr:hypothetical protein CDCA_CDCA03G0819 [Cyanidium caldarium]